MKILVVEDDPKHMERAVAIVNGAGEEAVPARDYREAMNILHAFKAGRIHLDGVISDIYLPAGKLPPSMRSEEETLPCGFGIALIAGKHGLPYVLCTAGYHHGTRYQWIAHVLNEYGQHDLMVDENPDDWRNQDKESITKDWSRALQVLREQIEKLSKK